MAYKRLGHPVLVVAGPFGAAQTNSTFDALEIPAGHFVDHVGVLITTVLSGGTPSIDVGDEADDDGWVDTLQITETSTGYYTGARKSVEANGTATVVSGTTSIAVTHGLGVTPGVNDILITAKENWGNANEWWVDTMTSTQFTINTDTNPGENVALAWQANVLVHGDTPYFNGKYYASAAPIKVVLSASLASGVFYVVARMWNLGL